MERICEDDFRRCAATACIRPPRGWDLLRPRAVAPAAFGFPGTPVALHFDYHARGLPAKLRARAGRRASVGRGAMPCTNALCACEALEYTTTRARALCYCPYSVSEWISMALFCPCCVPSIRLCSVRVDAKPRAGWGSSLSPTLFFGGDQYDTADKTGMASG